MRMIIHRNRIAALCGERVYFAPHIEVLEADHPERRFVAALCLHSGWLDANAPDKQFDATMAERCARAILMPEDEFDHVAHWPNFVLAERFGVPLDQVDVRRRDLWLEGAAPSRPGNNDTARSASRQVLFFFWAIDVLVARRWHRAALRPTVAAGRGAVERCAP
jgi:hypothetical protein